jgi:hypothetical protein
VPKNKGYSANKFVARAAMFSRSRGVDAETEIKKETGRVNRAVKRGKSFSKALVSAGQRILRKKR